MIFHYCIFPHLPHILLKVSPRPKTGLSQGNPISSIIESHWNQNSTSLTSKCSKPWWLRLSIYSFINCCHNWILIRNKFQWFTLDSVWRPHWLFADLLYCTWTFQVGNTLVLSISCISEKPISFLSFIFSVDGLKSWKWSHAGLCETMETNEGKVLGKLKIAYPGHPF